MLIDFGKEAEVGMQQLMVEYLDFIDDVVDELGSGKEINYVYEIFRNGTGADRQLRIFAETHDLKKVVDYMVEETSEGVFLEAPAAKERRAA